MQPDYLYREPVYHLGDFAKQADAPVRIRRRIFWRHSLATRQSRATIMGVR
jgi:hypothetical protein